LAAISDDACASGAGVGTRHRLLENTTFNLVWPSVHMTMALERQCEQTLASQKTKKIGLEQQLTTNNN
jgi:hypothetical protein